MWKPSREDPVESSASELALECEALLAGRYADHLRRQGRWAPAWAWVNVLAHATEEELAVAAAGGDRDQAPEPPGAHEWRKALTFLADDVLCYVEARGITLRQLQLSTLIPLELELMGRGDGPTLNPGQLAGTVMAAVHQHPSRRQP